MQDQNRSLISLITVKFTKINIIKGLPSNSMKIKKKKELIIKVILLDSLHSFPNKCIKFNPNKISNSISIPKFLINSKFHLKSKITQWTKIDHHQFTQDNNLEWVELKDHIKWWAKEWIKVNLLTLQCKVSLKTFSTLLRKET